MLHEDTITAKMVDILETMRTVWNIEPQNTQTFIRESQRPDITVKENGRDPVVIEVKIDDPRSPDLSGEAQAREHLGRQLASYERVTTTMALRLPHRFRHTAHRELADEFRNADDLYYVLLSGDDPEDVHRFPNEGWIKGSLTDIATAIRIGAIPISKVAKAALDLEHGINETAILLEAAIHGRPEIGQQIEGILHQETCEQTSRMAMLIITNAFVFQSSIAGISGMENVPSLRRLRTVEERLDSDNILEAWDSIRQVNYRPIFDVAYELVMALATDDRLVGKVLWLLRNTARKLVDRGLAQVHELAGIVFQRLIVDRKFIKTYYTRPESVALLSALVLPDSVLIEDEFEAVRKSLSNLKVADFACGTGALLNGVYQRILALYEQAGGNGRDIHQHMVENNLIGCDIMPNASHLTASLIASNFPDIKIGGTQIDVMQYGTRRADGRYALGALDLIENPEETLPLGLINTQRVRGDTSENDTPQQEFRHREMDIVVDNPPFTRAGADNSSTNPDVPTTIFGDRDPDIADQMRRALRAMENSIGNSNAGFGSYFVDLADRMLKTDRQGVMGFVLPIIALTSPDWQKVRNLWAREYNDVAVITIADAKIEDCAFSADTNMAECLVVACKGQAENTGRGTFVCLHRRPDSHLEALEIAKGIHRLQNVRCLEDPPIGGNPIKVGDKEIGQALNCSLQEVWAASRIREFALIQCAHHLANGHIWLPQQREKLEIPMTSVGEIATIYSYDHRQKSAGPFDIEDGASDEDSYPGLWHVNSENQRTLTVAPDCHAIIRSNSWDRAQQVLEKKGRVHHNAALHFNVNSLAVLFTERPTIGVNLLPTVRFNHTLYDYVWTLWSNSTLGMLCYWMNSAKRQAGRGWIRLKALSSMSTLDVRQLDETALQNAKRIFEEMKHKQMLPFNQMFEDRVRQELDRCLLSEVLGFSEETHPEVHEGVRILRERLCAEPSIHGGKQSRVVL